MSTAMGASDIDVGDLMIWTRLRLKFMLLGMGSYFKPDDLAGWSLEDLSSEIKKMLPLLKDIHRLLPKQRSILKEIAKNHGTVSHSLMPQLEKHKACMVIGFELSRAQLAEDVELEKHWQQLYDGSWKGEVKPAVTRAAILKLRAQLTRMQSVICTQTSCPWQPWRNKASRWTRS